MNQEKIMKAKMVTAFIMFFAALAGLFVMIGLYVDKSKEVQDTYKAKYKQNLEEAVDEIDTYLKDEKDFEIRYNMMISDLGAARNMVFLIDGYTDEQKTINELHYCYVKYPEQMKDKLKDTKTALMDIIKDLDKGYDEADEIVESVDKLGN